MEVNFKTRIKIAYLILFKFLGFGGSSENSASFICGSNDRCFLIKLVQDNGNDL
jgi:hypothetical protein